MPRIFGNISQSLLPALCGTLQVANRADFCVGYFNLRGWKAIDSHVEQWSSGPGRCCRLLVGMQRLPQDELREALSIIKRDGGIDNPTALRLKKRLAEEFRHQLTLGMPTNDDEAGLRRLAAQIKAKKVVVKLFVRHPLHAKLYLLFRPDPFNPSVGFVGSSNLPRHGDPRGKGNAGRLAAERTIGENLNSLCVSREPIGRFYVSSQQEIDRNFVMARGGAAQGAPAESRAAGADRRRANRYLDPRRLQGN